MAALIVAPLILASLIVAHLVSNVLRKTVEVVVDLPALPSADASVAAGARSLASICDSSSYSRCAS